MRSRMNSVDNQDHGLDYGLINNLLLGQRLSADPDVFDLHNLLARKPRVNGGVMPRHRM